MTVLCAALALPSLSRGMVMRTYSAISDAASLQKSIKENSILSDTLVNFSKLFLNSRSGTAAGGFSSKTNEQTIPVVRMVYLVPSDRAARPEYEAAMGKAVKNLRIWYRLQLGNVLTFKLYNPVVQVIATPHASSWYAANSGSDASQYWFWTNVLADAFALTKGSFNDPYNRWIFYIDADPSCGQVTGGTSGVAVLPANDLRGLIGEKNISPCENKAPDTGGICRWVGGLGHELGHAFNLPHPASCEAHEASCPSDTLMWLGYINYPDTYFLAEDKNKLKRSPFFSQMFTSQALPACGM